MNLRWGIISAGLISNDFCVALKTLDPNNHSITAIAARNLNDAKEFADRFQIKNYYNSYDQVCSDSEVDIVYVGCINNLHKDVCLTAIKNVKHVLCEKPLTITSEEQEEIFKAAESKGVFVMEAIWTRFFPVVERLKHEINNGSIGEVKIVQSSFLLKKNHVERLHKKELGGGCLLDVGIYPIQMVCLIFNHEEPKEIIASGHLMSSGADECFSVTLKYTNNRMAVITASLNCQMYAGTIIAGEKGVIQIPKFSWCPTELILHTGEKLEYPVPNGGKINFFFSTGLAYEAEAVREAIMNGWKEHPNVTHNHSRLIRRIMDEIQKQLGNQL